MYVLSPLSCSSGEDILRKMAGEQVTPRFLERHGFNYPIMVTEMEGLGLKLPPPTFSVLDVERYVGEDDELSTGFPLKEKTPSICPSNNCQERCS